MKVKDLIEILSGYDPELRIVRAIDSGASDFSPAYFSLEDILVGSNEGQHGGQHDLAVLIEECVKYAVVESDFDKFIDDDYRKRLTFPREKALII